MVDSKANMMAETLAYYLVEEMVDMLVENLVKCWVVPLVVRSVETMAQ
jgi:hypothetical protein